MINVRRKSILDMVLTAFQTTECAKTLQYTVSFSLTETGMSDKHATFYHNEKYLWKDFRDIVC